MKTKHAENHSMIPKIRKYLSKYGHNHRMKTLEDSGQRKKRDNQD